jgi:hypothetical protein
MKKMSCYFHWNLHERGHLSTLKGNNSCKTYNVRINVGSVQMVYYSVLSANWTFSFWFVPLIKVWITELTLIHKNIRSVHNLHVLVYLSIWRKTHYNVTDKNNNVYSEGFDRHYHKYPSLSYRTCSDISDNVCLDLQNCRNSIFIHDQHLLITL